MQDIDLTKRPPRSPRVRLCGYVILPRLLDKCRASIVGKTGEYHYNYPLDQRFFQFTGIDPDDLKAQVEKGLGDWEIAQWIEKNSPQKREEWEIQQWSTFRENAVPLDNESREFLNEMASGAGAAETSSTGKSGSPPGLSATEAGRWVRRLLAREPRRAGETRAEMSSIF